MEIHPILARPTHFTEKRSNPSFMQTLGNLDLCLFTDRGGV